MKGLKGFSVYELILIALMASLGIATKPVIVPLTHMVTGPLLIPGGALAGGIYMFWIVLAAGLVNKRGTATLTSFIQALIVLVTGWFGSHGLVSIITYTLPGIVIDLIFIIIRRKWTSVYDFFIAGILANLAGTYLSNLVFFRLPFAPLVLGLSCAALSGGVGGLIAFKIHTSINRMRGVVDEDN